MTVLIALNRAYCIIKKYELALHTGIRLNDMIRVQWNKENNRLKEEKEQLRKFQLRLKHISKKTEEISSKSEKNRTYQLRFLL